MGRQYLRELVATPDSHVASEVEARESTASPRRRTQNFAIGARAIEYGDEEDFSKIGRLICLGVEPQVVMLFFLKHDIDFSSADHPSQVSTRQRSRRARGNCQWACGHLGECAIFEI